MTQMNKDAYARIIKQDIEWLDNNAEPSLEREHIKTVLEDSIERFYSKDISSTGWIPCTEENYPDFTGEFVVIAYWDESDNKWYYWMFEDCPYGWNVLCRSEAYLKKLQEPIR